MSDPLDIAQLATHGGTAVLGAGGVGAFMRWLSGKETQHVSTQLALMGQKIDQLVAEAAKHSTTGERVALLEAEVKNINKRFEALVSPPPEYPTERRRGRK